MMGLFGRAAGRHTAGLLYSRVVTQARQPAFYSAQCVPDTIEGRFELVVLHCALVLRRLGRMGEPARRVGQEFLKYMFDDLDQSIREIGVGDMAVGKYMNRFSRSFYGHAHAYDAALVGNDPGALALALRRNVLGTAEADAVMLDAAAQALAEYVAGLAAKLDRCDLSALEAGAFHLSAPARQAA